MSLADIFLTPRQQKMLAPLLLNPEHSYRLSELLALSGAGRGASQKHIDNFVEAGVLQEERRGNQRCLQINQAFPLYEELRSICLKSFGLRDGLKSALEPLADQITDAFIFGSVASNTDRADSDIDLMVIGSVPLISLMDVIAPFEKTLGRSIYVHLHDEATWQELLASDPVIQQIINSPTIMILQTAKTECLTADSLT